MHIGFDQRAIQIGIAFKIEIHCQKCQIRSNVAAAKPLVKFNAVDDLDAVRSKIDVIGSQIAVALANFIILYAAIEQRFAPLQKRTVD